MATYKKSMEMRKKIMEATEHLILTKGYFHTNINEIAEHLNIPRSLIYYYFSNKEDLMHEITEEHYRALEQRVDEIIPQGENPLVRVVVRNLLFFRNIAWNPILTEYIVSNVDYPSKGGESASAWIERYYADSEVFFKEHGMSVDSNRFRVHVLMTEVVWKALVTGVYYKTVDLTEREMMEYYLERTVMITFGMSREKIEALLEETYALVDRDVPAPASL